jgi:predicted nucleic acid-binding protein
VASYFFDSSALFKRYAVEPGTSWVLGITDPAAGNDIYVVQITGVEIVSALARQTPALPATSLTQALLDFKHDFRYQYHRVAITEALIDRAMSLAEGHRLRGYDAIQLAAAVELQAAARVTGLGDITFVCADARLNSAASNEGLTVEDPATHP